MSEEEGFSEQQLCRENLISYCIAQYPQFVFPKHILLLAKKLEDVAKGKIKRLMVFAPPRHGKSETVSKLFPAWYIGYTKGKNTVAVATYGQDLSNEIGTALNQRMNSDVYKEIFPEAVPSDNSNSIKRLVTINGGGYITVGVGGGLTGKGAHLRILDDPNKNREEAESDTEQRKQREWWTSVFMTRGEQEITEDGAPTSDEDESPIVIILTRWSDKDIVQWLLDKQKEEDEAGVVGDKWEVINLEAICESEGDPLGRTPVSDPEDSSTWEDKHALWPQKFSAKKLAKLKIAVGPRDWNSLYQQRPSSAAGDLFKRDAWQFYEELPPEVNKPVQSWDMNYKDTDGSDFVVGIVGAKHRGRLYLIDRVKGRFSFPVTQRKIIETKYQYPETTAIYIERKANGGPIITTLEKDVSGIIGVDPEALGSKNARWEAAARYQQAHNIFLPKGAPWVDDFIEQMAAVPNGKNDDDADSFAQMVIKELGSFSIDGLIKAIEKELEENNVPIHLNDETNPYDAIYGTIN